MHACPSPHVVGDNMQLERVQSSKSTITHIANETLSPDPNICSNSNVGKFNFTAIILSKLCLIIRYGFLAVLGKP